MVTDNCLDSSASSALSSSLSHGPLESEEVNPSWSRRESAQLGIAASWHKAVLNLHCVNPDLRAFALSRSGTPRTQQRFFAQSYCAPSGPQHISNRGSCYQSCRPRLSRDQFTASPTELHADKNTGAAAQDLCIAPSCTAKC